MNFSFLAINFEFECINHDWHTSDEKEKVLWSYSIILIWKTMIYIINIKQDLNLITGRLIIFL
jgi:hypothetical protein